MAGFVESRGDRAAQKTSHRRTATVLLSAAAMALTGASAAWAHHSFSAYDMSKQQTQRGTIKEFRWGAPHVSMVLAYKDKSGKAAAMSVTTGSPIAFSRQGFTARDFRRGDTVTMVYHPNVSGQPGGALSSLALADGRTFSDGEAKGATGGAGGPPRQ